MKPRTVSINYLKFIFNSILRKKRPVASVLCLTGMCNHKCSMCPVSRVREFKDLSTKEWKIIIDKLSEYVVYMCLEGGEPTLRKDIAEIIKYAHDAGPIIQLTNNGTLLHKVLPKCKGMIDSVCVSFDTKNKLTYKKQRGADTFDRVVNNIKLGIDLGFNVMLNCVITKFNVGELISGKYFDFIKKLRVKSVGITLVEKYPKIEYILPSDKEIKEAMRSILNYIENDNSVPVSIPPSYFESILQYGKPQYNECRIYTSINVNHDGIVVAPCWKFVEKNKQFSLLKKDIDFIWDNTKWVKCNDCVLHCVYFNSRVLRILPNFKDLRYAITFGKNSF